MAQTLSPQDADPQQSGEYQDEEANLERMDIRTSALVDDNRSPSPTSTMATEYEYNPLDDTDPLAPPQQYRRAAFELIGETHAGRQQAITAMRTRLREYYEKQVGATVEEKQGTLISRSDDRTIMVFVRSSKFVIDKAFREYICFCKAHAEHSWLREVNVDMVEQLFASGSYQILPKTDAEGRLILSMDMDFLVPFVETLERSRSTELLGSLFGMLETLMFDIRAQVFGIVILADLSGLKMQTFGYLTAQEYLLSLDLVQHAYPLRAKSMLLVREPWYVRGLFNFMRPFMSANAKKALKIFGDDVEAIHSFIPRDALTEHFGGSLKLGGHENKDEWIEAVRQRFLSPSG